MKTFKIEIIETLARTIKVQADSIEDAILKTHKLYRNEKIVLDENDYIDTSIELYDDNVKKYTKRELIDDIIKYLIEDEKKHYEEFEKNPENHIYLKLKKLQDLNNPVRD